MYCAATTLERYRMAPRRSRCMVGHWVGGLGSADRDLWLNCRLTMMCAAEDGMGEVYASSTTSLRGSGGWRRSPWLRSPERSIFLKDVAYRQNNCGLETAATLARLHRQEVVGVTAQAPSAAVP